MNFDYRRKLGRWERKMFLKYLILADQKSEKCHLQNWVKNSTAGAKLKQRNVKVFYKHEESLHLNRPELYTKNPYVWPLSNSENPIPVSAESVIYEFIEEF